MALSTLRISEIFDPPSRPLSPEDRLCNRLTSANVQISNIRNIFRDLQQQDSQLSETLLQIECYWAKIENTLFLVSNPFERWLNRLRELRLLTDTIVFPKPLICIKLQIFCSFLTGAQTLRILIKRDDIVNPITTTPILNAVESVLATLTPSIDEQQEDNFQSECQRLTHPFARDPISAKIKELAAWHELIGVIR